MPVASLSLKRQISNVIKHFKFEELETSVLPVFPEISWNKIKAKLVKYHLNFSVHNAIRMIEEVIDECRISQKSLKERLSILEVIDVSRHHTKKIWYCYELKGSIREINFMTKRDIENKVIDYFNVQQLSVEVQTTSYDGIMFAAIKENPKTRKSVRVTPIYFALLLGQNYFFCSKKNVTSHFIKAIETTMGHKSSKSVKLSGRDLSSLIKIIWQKKQGVNDANTEDVPYRDSKPVIKSTGIDFTQYKHRKEYLEKCFGNEPPTVESLILDSDNQTWKEEEAFAKLPDKKIPLGWEFRSHNVSNFLQNLAKYNIIEFPIPLYLSQWMTTGKNHLTLKEN